MLIILINLYPLPIGLNPYTTTPPTTTPVGIATLTTTPAPTTTFAPTTTARIVTTVAPTTPAPTTTAPATTANPYDAITQAEGKHVRLYYKEVLKNFFWQSDTPYLIEKVEIVK
jgi:hypothetical protein